MTSEENSDAYIVQGTLSLRDQAVAIGAAYRACERGLAKMGLQMSAPLDHYADAGYWQAQHSDPPFRGTAAEWRAIVAALTEAP